MMSPTLIVSEAGVDFGAGAGDEKPQLPQNVPVFPSLPQFGHFHDIFSPKDTPENTEHIKAMEMTKERI